MNKTALKTFAINARKELLKKVEAKAMRIGITEDNIKKADIVSSDAIFIDGKQLAKEELIQRDKLIARINQIGFKQVMEEVAYTWFNRFTALRYMEVNEYLPTDVRVLSSTNVDSSEPDMINEALSLDLEIDKEYVYDLKLNNNSEELFKYLIIKHCNNLNRYLPFMFETIDDYTEILFPEGMLAKDSFIRQMTDTDLINEDNWQKVEVIGWLYQYYIAEEKDRVIQAKKKYKTEEIPFATQLFTPDWIVRYMVQNSLGRYWLESHPENRDLLEKWEFYLENSNTEHDFEEKLAPYIKKDLKVEDIKCFDPAMGSGHILVYMFDVLFEIYSKCGYMEREIPRLIIENNLHGLDIDDRAYQLACFSVVMKALAYNKRFLRSIEREGLKLNLVSIQETNLLHEEEFAYIAGESSGNKFDKTKEFIVLFRDAKTFGSLIRIEEYDKEFLLQRLEYIQGNPAKDLFEEEIRKKVLELFPYLLNQAELMSKQYDILVTNPPYMGSKYMNSELSVFMKENYSDTKSDTFSAFIEYSMERIHENGHLGFITPFVWMFITSYEKLRSFMVNHKTISSLIQFEYNAFPEACVPVCCFTLRNSTVNLKGDYIRLSDFPGSDNQKIKTIEAISNPKIKYRYSIDSNVFKKLPGNIVAYWISEKVVEIFSQKTLSDIADPRVGLQTGKNDLYMRYWFEVENRKIGFGYKNRDQANESNKKWFPFNKGGAYRKWFGNNIYIVDYQNDGVKLRNFQGAVIRNPNYYFKESITWSRISSSKSSFRFNPNGFVFSDAGPCLFVESSNIHHIIGYLNSKVANYFLTMLNPTLTFQVGDIAKICFIHPKEYEDKIKSIVDENIDISKNDWDSYELSWDFKKHNLLKYLEVQEGTKTIENSFNKLNQNSKVKFNKMKQNEEELNQLFIDLYYLQGEVDPIISDEDITIKKTNNVINITSFISYVVGCIFGRYSLDEEGLIYAGGEFEANRYHAFQADKDNILPILSGAYFEDDIVSKFVEFVQVTFGKETLTENLDFIAYTLGKKKGETAKETIRRYFLNDFFKDHVQTYKKRPIYWLFTSGKQKAFNCLIYIHRYDKTTLSRIRTDYLHEYQIRLDGERKSIVNIIEGDSTAKEISNAKKELKVLDKKIEELKEYDEILHHMADMQIEIDLDDGVVVNYEKFKALVAKI
ncbi:BREX-1 system adenine-specific DNA-methyltransferase PglX [Neobacillus drentensis]|uniref:BREX-1 system adenine-specific DNA-methyltransferase PglX n=1 Tax=Neobacillus drentensis TaxID=220684 RepID=UPI003000D2C3